MNLFHKREAAEGLPPKKLLKKVKPNEEYANPD